MDFYKHFLEELKDKYYSCITNSYEKESLSYSQRMLIMTLHFKKGDKNLLGDYRPISLPNTDYKIIAFIFARRLQKVLDSIISQNQSAYVKGRFIGINARLIIDIFEYCENLGEESILLFLDFHKAFDSVEWSFLFETLKCFNFGEKFIKWMQILYKNPIFRLKKNNLISKTCSMERGIRQGCPVSAILFLFVAEILSIKIRQNEEIKGFFKKGYSLNIFYSELQTSYIICEILLLTRDLKKKRERLYKFISLLMLSVRFECGAPPNATDETPGAPD